MSVAWSIYGSVSADPADKAVQIRHLAAIGVAASETPYNIRDLSRCYVSLFEVIADLAHQIEEGMET